MTTKVHIFSNGTEYNYWNQNNCVQCPHSCYNNGQADYERPNCKIEDALTFGEVTRRQRWFAGYERPGDCTTWRCLYVSQMDKREALNERAKAWEARQALIDAGQMELFA